MIRCSDRMRLLHALETAKAALTEHAESPLIKLPSDRSAPQFDHAQYAEKREEVALDAYLEHIRIHRCLM